MKLVPVAVAMFYRPGASGGFETWVQQRTDGPLKDKWEFPGGKIEAGESPWEALVREIREETNVVVAGTGDLLGIFSHDYGDKRVLLHVFRVPWVETLALATGRVVPLSPQKNGSEWGLDLLPANFQLVDHLCRSLYDRGDEPPLP